MSSAVANLPKPTRLIIKVAVSGLLFYLIYAQLGSETFAHFELQDVVQLFKNLAHPAMLAVLLMVLLNWGIESRKWQLIISRLQPMSFRIAVKSVLAGVLAGQVGGNRMLELGGRMVTIEKDKLGRALALSALSSIPQIVVTFLAGLASLILVPPKVNIDFISFNPDIRWLAAVISTLIVVSLLAISFFPASWWNRIKQFKYDLRKLIETFAWQEITHLIWLSCARFLVYTAQFGIMLWLCAEVPFWGPQLIALWLVFFFQLMSKSIPMIDFAIRGNLALFILGPHCGNEIGLIFATYALWVINLIIPSIIALLWLSFGKQQKREASSSS